MLNQPDSFYSEMASFVDERRVMDIVYLNFSKAFDTVSHNILIDTMTKYRLDNWTGKCFENWLNDWAQRV